MSGTDGAFSLPSDQDCPGPEASPSDHRETGSSSSSPVDQSLILDTGGFGDVARERFREQKEVCSTTGPIPQSQLPTELVEELRQEARRSLFFLAKGILGYKDLSRKIHLPLCQQLQKMVEPGNRHLRVVLPRSWFKSTICSIAFPIWLVLQDTVMGVRGCNLRICIAQNSEKNALKKLSELGGHFLQNGLFQMLFPELVPTKTETWKAETKSVPRTEPFAEGTFEAIGIRSKTVSRHYDVIIEDDTVAPDADEYGIESLAPTKDDIDQAIGWHKAISPYFTDPNNHLHLVVGTRWFEMDLLEHIRQKEPFFHSYERGILERNGVPDESGEPSWPERFGPEVITQYQMAMGPYMFSCLYLNKPISAANALFRLEWFRYFDRPPEDLVCTTTVDPGGDPESAKGKVDYTVVLTVGKHIRTGDLYLLEYSRDRKNVGWLVDTLFEHVRRYNPVKVGIETQGYQKMLLPIVKERSMAEKVYFVVESITNNRLSKNQRIQALIPFFSSGVLRIQHHHQALVSELLSFPNGSHDDVADALSMQTGMWQITVRDMEGRQNEAPDPMSVEASIAVIEAEQEKKPGVNRVFDVLVDHPLMFSGFNN